MKRLLAFTMAFMMMIGAVLSSPHNLNVFAADETYKTWKQSDERWRDTPTGGTDTLWHYGCLVTACAMLMVKSGAEPNDVNQFNPGIYCDRLRNDGMFDSYGNLNYIKQSYSPNFYYELSNDTEVLPDAYDTIYYKIQNWLNEGYYIIVGVKWNGSENGHWVAVDYCADGEVYIMDPGYFDSYTLRRYDGGISGIKLIKAKNIYGTQANPPEEKTPSKPIVTVASSDESHPVIVNYNACSDATNYDIRFYNANNDELIYGIGCFQEAINFGTNVVYTDTSYSHSFQAGSYYVTVAAVNNKKASNWWNYSDKVYFTVTESSEYPEKPIVHVEAGYSDNETVITWQACKNIADPYYYRIYNSSTGEEVRSGQSGKEYPEVELEGQSPEDTCVKEKLPAGEYYVIVTSCNHFYTMTVDSDKVYFTVKDALKYPDKPEVTVNATDEAHPVTVSYNSCTNATDYCIRYFNADGYVIYAIGDSEDSRNFGNGSDYTDTSHSYSLPAGTYKVTVAAINANDGVWTFSDPVPFTVNQAPKVTTTTPKAITTTTKTITTTTKTITTTTKTITTTTKTTTTTTKPELKINKTSVTITNGDQYTITANRNDVTYKSNNPDVAIVSSNGVITAVGAGQATISAFDSDSNVVQIKVEVTAITTTSTLTTTKETTTTMTTTTTKMALKIDKTSVTMTNGNQYTIIANRNDVTYKSNNPDVAIVSSNGVITAVGAGQATISAFDSDSNVVQIKVEVTAITTTTTTQTTTMTTSTTPKPTTTTSTSTSTTTKATTTTSMTTTTTKPELKIDKTSVTMTNGDQYTIIANRNDVTYKSNNPDVAVVSSNGVITAVGAGQATISAFDSDSNVVQIKVEVTAITTTTTTQTTTMTTSTTPKPTTTTNTTTATTTTVQTTTVTTVTTEPPVSDIMLGDVNGDKEISVEDAQLTLNAYVKIMAGMDSGLTDQQAKAANVNKDSEVSVDDAQTILLYYVRNTLSGTTTTWDELLGKATPASPRPPKVLTRFLRLNIA